MKRILQIMLVILLGVTSLVCQPQAVMADSDMGQMVVAGNNGLILAEHNAQKQYPAGNLSKLLALYLVMDAIKEGTIKEDTLVTPSQRAYTISQDYDISNVPLRADYEYTVKQLIRPVIIGAANGAMLTLVEAVAGSEEAFVKKMNEQLEAWTLTDYQLVDALGLPGEYEWSLHQKKGVSNQMSAEVVATIAYHLANDFPNVLNESQVSHDTFMPGTTDAFDISNPNGLLMRNDGGLMQMNGLMMDNSMPDRWNLVVTAHQKEDAIITVLMHYDQEEVAYNDARKLLETAYGEYSFNFPIEKGTSAEQIGKVAVHGAEEGEIYLTYLQDGKLVLPTKDGHPTVDYYLHLDADYTNQHGELKAPIPGQTHVGAIHFTPKGTEENALRALPSTPGNQIDVGVKDAVERASTVKNSVRSVGQFFGAIWNGIRRFFVRLIN